MKIVATALFERLVHMAHCPDATDPASPRLVVDARCRDGDLDGPLLLTVAMFAVFCPPGTAATAVSRLRDAGRVVSVDAVAHIAFPTWTMSPDAIVDLPGRG
ncbi:MAG: hypothetical protein U0U69_08300 [Acidimicrobiia bacterium]